MKNKQLLNLLPIETERLIIKSTSLEDVDLLLKMDKQVETQKYLGGIKNKTKEERLEFLKRKVDKINSGIASSLTVSVKETPTPIAFVGLKISEEENSAELSYIFDYDYTKKGYCTEIIKKLIEIGFSDLKLTKVWADTIVGNDNSKKVLEKLNFQKTNERKENETIFEIYELINKNLQ
ncbi:MAG: GNAT family N-acetyltransferase [Bacilli bacterium]|nr:GNAT family N-acetyltransferase [Bacilli bacterium]